MSKLVLAYWDLRGLGEPCRLMLECAGVEYEDKRLQDDEEWGQCKIELGMDFPNLPYLHKGDFKLSESMAIMRHFGRQYDMMPAAGHENLGDMLEGVVNDFRWSFYKLCYSDYEAEKDAYFDGITVKMDRFESHLSKNAWIVGDKLTYVDFVLCEILSQMMIAKPDLLRSHKKMGEYLSKFERLEGISAYRNSPRFKAYPCTGPLAGWRGIPK